MQNSLYSRTQLDFGFRFGTQKLKPVVPLPSAFPTVSDRGAESRIPSPGPIAAGKPSTSPNQQTSPARPHNYRWLVIGQFNGRLAQKEGPKTAPLPAKSQPWPPGKPNWWTAAPSPRSFIDFVVIEWGNCWLTEIHRLLPPFFSFI